jgi:eukaryotic-like serine/threonine-protein kinase
VGKSGRESDARAAELVGQFLARREGGESTDFEALCRAHPELAEEMRGLLAASEHVVALLRQVSGKTGGLVEDLARRFGAEVDPGITLQPLPDESEAGSGGELLRRLRAHRTMGKRYRLLGEVGRGGMGTVLKVWDADLRRPLAMKVVLGRDAESSGQTPPVDPRTLGRFLEEAQVTGQLDHPGIVPVHELGLDSEGRVYFTMRLVRGRELKAIFGLVETRAEGWTLSRTLGVLLRVCEAMAFAHDKGVVHRDLKPSNVMVGRFGEVYVMDWARGDPRRAPCRRAAGDERGRHGA